MNLIKYMCYNLSYVKDVDIDCEITNVTYNCGTVNRVLRTKIRKDTRLKFYKETAVRAALYGDECGR